jgi:PAS domain S-box-containing protein
MDADLMTSIDLEAVVQSAADAIVTADEHGLIRGWNRAAERIFGYSAAIIVGQPLTVLIPERFQSAHDAGLGRVVRTGETRVIGKTVELAGLHADGSEFPIELSLSTWTRDGNHFFAGIIRDISERVRLMRALASSQAQLQAVLRSATDAIVCANSAGLITLWNPAAERLLGYGAAEIVGSSLTKIVPERFRAVHEAGLARAAAGGAPRIIGKSVEVFALRADGLEIPVELSLAAWTIDEDRFFGAVIRDITERRQAEESLRAAHDALAEKSQQLEGLSAKLAKYLSRQLYQSIFEGRHEVRVTSYRKKLTIFFSDIQGFAELTDSMEAESLSQLLNEYLSEMSVIAAHHGGTIDKFIGDGIMIFFGDPESRGERDDAVACVEMALAMRRRVHGFQQEWQDRGIARLLQVRMGINTGFVTVGNFGSEDRLDYTIVGGQVNAAARLEVIAEPDQILISHETYALVKERVRCEPVGELKVKGIAYPIRTYQVLGSHAELGDLAATIDEQRQGFRLHIDPSQLSPGDAETAREALRRALKALRPRSVASETVAVRRGAGQAGQQ